MPSKVDKVAETALEDGLLVSAQHVDLLCLALVSLPDILQKASLLLETLLRGFQADEGSCADIAGCDGGVEPLDVGGDVGETGGCGGDLQLQPQAVGVLKVL